MRTRSRMSLGLLLLSACGATAPVPGGGDTDAGTPGPGGDYDLPSISYAVDAGAPIDAPRETWTFVPVPDAHCANGSSTGMAVNLTDRSKRVLVFLAGGGACWEAAACALGTATHITDTMGEAPVLAEAGAQNLAPLFDREDPGNPFRDASFVYIPYCTGDLHAGTRVKTYDWFGPRNVEHVGARNMDAYLRRLQPTFRDADRVWLSGVSAGGYGATLHWWRVQKALPWARVDVLNDSGLVIDTAGDGRYSTMQQSWGMEFPPGCAGCGAGMSEVLGYSTRLLAAPRRYGLLGYVQDGTIALYFGLNGAQVQARLEAARASAEPGVKTFYLPGNQHVLLTTPDASSGTGPSVREWLQAMAGDAPGWSHAGP
ncbi:pectin acetylesterase-family hydrolase [Pyxidicoccus sp. MSG2]|uniref:pectin acetylesterase-family hydrolase n=1 Tax=Pyxidicoccus sp. MSG2 TaxID=2996790 RepID=UPI0022720A72|nr:pectin acetylesterase-family hydrolase [Pyxidicoccus sp. MSG2]MCY1014938.1 pectin acetylesterase-family hydrolase [Pyxidicoccus sp. MSG2]